MAPGLKHVYYSYRFIRDQNRSCMFRLQVLDQCGYQGMHRYDYNTKMTIYNINMKIHKNEWRDYNDIVPMSVVYYDW